MKPISYIDRKTGKEAFEDVYGGKALGFLYGNTLLSRFFGRPLAHILSKNALLSTLYGWAQKQSWTKKKVGRFIHRFGIDSEEFLEPVSHFHSFNDFFIRKLKKNARPIAAGQDVAVIPADGRYRFIPRIDLSEGFIIKGEKFSLADFLQSEELAQEYAKGSMVMARLCPVDYHRFHFPCDGIPSKPHLINGALYSVNPTALKKNIHIYSQNKRMITTIKTDCFQKVLYIEIGATNVGTIHETYTPDQPCVKGEEKGYFSFGGSALVLLFLPNTITFDDDLLEYSKTGKEILCQMGQPMGKSH